MPYSSSLSDKEMDGILYQLKNGCNWADLPKDLPPCLGAHSLATRSDAGSHRYSTVYWHYKQWRAASVFEELMRVLHEQVRAQIKKSPNGQG
ncbi:MAG: transposase [Cyanobacteria bacterium P01_D01_bin.105]